MVSIIIEVYRINRPALAIHGGAGNWAKIKNDEDKYINVLKEALSAGFNTLKTCGDSIRSVVESVKILENSTLYNAGSGSSLNLIGEREMDAGLMDGNSMKAGAVTLIKNIKNPIELAYIIYSFTDHFIIGGKGAEKIAQYYNLDRSLKTPPHVIKTFEETKKNIDKIKHFKNNRNIAKIFGELDTVGAIAIDPNGILASATSTGGLLLKLPGRIGDSPIPGAGFYSDQNIACSATGIGEAIMSISLCRSIALHYRYLKDLKGSVEKSFKELEAIWGKDTAGVIVISKDNTLVFAYNTKAMARGYIDSRSIYVKIF